MISLMKRAASEGTRSLFKLSRVRVKVRSPTERLPTTATFLCLGGVGIVVVPFLPDVPLTTIVRLWLGPYPRNEARGAHCKLRNGRCAVARGKKMIEGSKRRRSRNISRPLKPNGFCVVLA